MVIDELVLKNFGVYAGTQRCQFTGTSSKQPIILFGGLNGAGKTTLMDAVQLALYGKMAQCSNRGVLSYENYLKASIHRGTAPGDDTGIELAFRYRADEQEDAYRIKRYWCYTDDKIREQFEVERNGIPDVVLAESWFAYIEQLIPVTLTQLFFFDGERLADLTDPRKTASFIRTTIYALHGLNIVDRLRTDLGVLARRQRSELSTELANLDTQLTHTTDDKERAALQNQRDILEAQISPNTLIDDLESEIQDLTNQLSSYRQELGAKNKAKKAAEQRLQRADEQFQAKGGEIYERKTELEHTQQEFQDVLGQLDVSLGQLAADASLPFVLVPDLVASLHAQDAHEAQQVPPARLDPVLQERDQTILEHLAARATTLSIEQGALQSLTNDLQDFLQSDRSRRTATAIEEILGLTPTERQVLHALPSRHRTLRKEVEDIIHQRDDAAGQADEVDRLLHKVPEEDTLQQIHQARENAKRAVQTALRELALVEREINTIQATVTDEQGTPLLDDQGSALMVGSLPTLRKRLRHEQQQQAEALLNVTDASRVIKHAMHAQAILETFMTRVVEQHLRHIERFVLECFQLLLRKKDLITHIAIDPRNFHLRLTAPDGLDMSPERLSAGERQLLAVAILWGLRKATKQPFPAMIDTPLSRLDGTHRTTVLQQYFPQASDQVVLLSTDEEINKAGVEALQSSIAKGYRLDFNDDTDATTITPGYFW